MPRPPGSKGRHVPHAETETASLFSTFLSSILRCMAHNLHSTLYTVTFLCPFLLPINTNKTLIELFASTSSLPFLLSPRWPVQQLCICIPTKYSHQCQLPASKGWDSQVDLGVVNSLTLTSHRLNKSCTAIVPVVPTASTQQCLFPVLQPTRGAVGLWPTQQWWMTSPSVVLWLSRRPQSTLFLLLSRFCQKRKWPTSLIGQIIQESM